MQTPPKSPTPYELPTLGHAEAEALGRALWAGCQALKDASGGTLELMCDGQRIMGKAIFTFEIEDAPDAE